MDDDESLRLSLKIFLARDGYGRISDVSSYEEAMEIVSSRHLDLIISDIILKGASGIDLLRQVKAKGLRCPVVVMTGYPCAKTTAESKQLGAFEYLHKPVKKEDILRVTRKALQQQVTVVPTSRAASFVQA